VNVPLSKAKKHYNVGQSRLLCCFKMSTLCLVEQKMHLTNSNVVEYVSSLKRFLWGDKLLQMNATYLLGGVQSVEL